MKVRVLVQRAFLRAIYDSASSPKARVGYRTLSEEGEASTVSGFPLAVASRLSRRKSSRNPDIRKGTCHDSAGRAAAACAPLPRACTADTPAKWVPYARTMACESRP